MNYTTQKSINCDDLHKMSLLSHTTVEEPVLRRIEADAKTDAKLPRRLGTVLA